MNKVFFRRAAPGLVSALLLFTFNVSAQYTNGIYAEFNTSMGSYTCRLEYALAPKTVANFISLATGQRSWLSETSGVVRTDPLYNGVIFHRVISNFMNQAGSPTGLGNGGPGYQFVDEFTPGLRHDGFGVLSMANSGPDSNGSQFFITVTAQPQLNDVHSVFGRLYGGSNVVLAINRVTTDASDRPLTNVVLNSVAIRRIGAAALAFDIQTNGLPLVTNLSVKISPAGTNAGLTFSNRINVDNRLFASANLTSWVQTLVGVETAVPVTNTIYRSAGAARQFYRMAQVQYASNLFPPRSVLGRTLSITFTNGTAGTLVVTFNANGTNGGGTYVRAGNASQNGTGSLLGYNYALDPFNGKLLPIGFLGPWDADMTITLNFDTATAGGVKAVVYPPPYYPNTFAAYSVSGHFTITP